MTTLVNGQERAQLVQRLMDVMYQYSRQGKVKEALHLGEQIYQLVPNNVQLLSDLATYNVFLQNWIEAIKYGLLCITLNSGFINAYDAVAHSFGQLRDWQQAGKYGHIALELRDAINRTQNPIPPVLQSKPDMTGKQNIISFSLYGDSSAYIETAVLNAELVEDIYPGWVCRFYVDETVPECAIHRLRENGAEIIYATEEMKYLPATMWRFLALDDESAGYVIFRDADAVISKREATTVAEWLASGQRFHTIRDAGSHTELVLAGLWGAMASSIPDFSSRMYAYAKKGNLHWRYADQFFLRDYIWQYIRQDVYASDRIFDFCNAHPITKLGENYDITHIGCDEGGMKLVLGNLDFADDQTVVWCLYSQISPLLNDDLSPCYMKERQICSYQATVKNKSISLYLPKRYGDGIKVGKSRITVRES